MTFATYPSADGVWHNIVAVPELIDPAPAAPLRQPALMVRDGVIAWLGEADALPAAHAQMRRHRGGGALLTPGLVDCHTHLVYAGNRAQEFAQRLAGATYEDIARAGGGIASTVRATRATDAETLFQLASQRLEALMADGVCAIEIKSGYGLELATERKQLQVARRLADAPGIVVRTTFLGAHTLPPEFAGRADAYIDSVCNDMLPVLAAEGLVDAVDVFCERIAFSRAQTERVYDAAHALGLPVKLHAEQLSDMDGAALAARHGAMSAANLEHLSAAGVAAMRDAGTVAVLLPAAYYALRETHLPPIAALRAAGVPMAVATDHNPGTSPMLSLLLAMNMACTLFRMTVEEALAGVTRNAARALRIDSTHGTLGVGKPANFVLWNVASAAELAYWIGQRPARTLVRQGRVYDPRHATSTAADS